MTGFSKRAGKGTKTADQSENAFIRSKKGNPLLPELQVRGKFFDLVDESATLWVDADGIPYKTASSVEEDYIEVVLKAQEDEVEDHLTFKGKFEFKNKTEFKGRARGDNISAGSLLSDKNIEREVNGLPEFKLEDFDITPLKRLKYEDGVTIDEQEFTDSFEVCKYFIDKWIEACLVQTQLNKIKLVIGSGDTHRHSVLVPHQYKSERTESRPLLLTKARKYLVDKYDTYIAPELFEADEIVDAVAAKDYDKSRKTGQKLKVVKSAQDKDARSKRGVLFDWNKSFHFDNPQCWHIPAFDEGVGKLELKKGKIKGGGAVFFAYQLLMEDTADEYSPRKYLPKDFTHFGKGYGDAAFYKDFAPLKTSQEVFQLVVDKYFEWFPYGLQYTAWDGTEVDEDTLAYLQKHFQLAWMLEGREDKTTIRDILDEFEVDYEKLKGNNKSTAPTKTFVGNEEHLLSIEELLTDIIKNDFKGLKVMKKADQGIVLDSIKAKLEGINFEDHYEMRQEKKVLSE
ncbi:putative exonuclease [Vibrio phage 424E50-1]|nr:putative exonuclease [Vibrio phage 424E50-1]